jgi:hypothetical protein
MVFLEQGLPHADKIIDSIDETDSLPQPDVNTDGLLPFMISRLRNNEQAIKDAVHQVNLPSQEVP